MGPLSFLVRVPRYTVRLYEWARGRRPYPWTSSPPHRLFGLIAHRAYGWPGAHYRAIYAWAGGLLKYRERLYGDRINFAARLRPPVNAKVLLNAALWQRAVLALPPLAGKAHVNLHVDGKDVQLDRLMSILLMSDSVRSINILFGDEAARAARLSTLTMEEEKRGWQATAFDLNADQPIDDDDFHSVDWSSIFSNRTGFDRNVNNYLKIAHPGEFVVALSLPESDDGFCDQWLPAWREAVQAFRSPLGNVSFVVLNAITPETMCSDSGLARRTLSFARTAGLSLAEAICLAQKCDAFIGQTDVFGLAARAAKRPGVYIGSGFRCFADTSTDMIHAESLSPAEACQRLGDILAAIPKQPRIGAIRTSSSIEGGIEPSSRNHMVETSMNDEYTLLIPTYNRPELLGRLLAYLQRQKAAFPVVVLDSSKPEMRARNHEVVSAAGIHVRLAEFDETIDPYVKMREGFGMVATPYCSICADDDLPIVTAVQRSVLELKRDGKAAVAHGYYFNFREQQDALNLSYVVYRGRSLDNPQPSSRLRALFAAYEAVLYGVFRTEVARRAFRNVERMNTVLGKELLTAALSVIGGKSLRIADFYYGRNTAESLAYTAWHPHQILASDPRLLFSDYPVFRELLAQALAEAQPDSHNRAQAEAIDLILLRYLQQFLRHDVLDLMIDMKMRGHDAAAIVTKVWDVFVRTTRRGHPVEPLLDSRRSYSPSRMGPERPKDYEWTARGWDGKERKYTVFFEFLFPEMQSAPLVDREKLVSLLDSLNAY